MMAKSTERFTSRVENYVRYRPHYPAALINALHAGCGLTAETVIADIGSGTGILSELFLRNGNTVYAVEPNVAMREAGERLLAAYPRFHSVAGTAEGTTLAPASVDLVTAGQAFHWFDPAPTRAEFMRILKPHGWVALVWNDRRETSTAFGRGYEALLHTYGTDYAAVNHKRIDQEALQRFFGSQPRLAAMENSQLLDYTGLEGRLLSSSYAPEAGHPQHAPMLAELRRLFDQVQVDGQVAVEYETRVYFGRLG